MKGLVDHPEDRLNAVAGFMKSVGAELLQYYNTTGKYDFLIISEGNNISDVMAGLMVAGSSGGVKNLTTVEALTTQEAKMAMEKANAARAGFKLPGS
jgi:uncharacterized protein with GYD domain